MLLTCVAAAAAALVNPGLTERRAGVWPLLWDLDRCVSQVRAHQQG